MNNDDDNQKRISDIWQAYLTTGDVPDYVGAPWYTKKRFRDLTYYLPSNPRCRICYYPFKGMGGTVMRTLFGIRPSKLNPHLCNVCEQFLEKYQGGTEIDLAILFADVRGSTALAEEMSPTEFSKLINHFYNATTNVLFTMGAMVEKLSGDAVTGFFTPGHSGPDYARAAVQAARKIQSNSRAISRDSANGENSLAVPVGIGIHTGRAYVGAVSSDSGVTDLAVLGDTANIGARLAAMAAPGEIVISQDAAQLAGLDPAGIEIRSAELKGRSTPIQVWVL